MTTDAEIIDQYHAMILAKAFPCVGAKASLSRDQVRSMVATHMACPHDDMNILQFLYAFIDHYRSAGTAFHSATVIFRQPIGLNEQQFDALLWERLRAIRALDIKDYSHDPRVSADPAAPTYSFSLKEEALFIVGMHPASSRRSRSFAFPTLVFNPHAEFEKLRNNGRYESMKATVRKRDVRYSGSVNPTLRDFGEDSEVFQYSGLEHPANWKCPLIDDPGNEDNPTP